MFRLVVKSEDIQTLAGMADEIWKEHYISINAIDCIEYMLEKFQSYEAISEQIEKENYEYYFVIYENNIVGYIGIQPQDNYLFLSKLYILQNYRGLSLGKKCIEFVKQKAKEKNLTKITLTVNKKNYGSIEFYKFQGFKIIQSVVTDIGNGYAMDDYIMEYNL